MEGGATSSSPGPMSAGWACTRSLSRSLPELEPIEWRRVTSSRACARTPPNRWARGMRRPVLRGGTGGTAGAARQHGLRFIDDPTCTTTSGCRALRAKSCSRLDRSWTRGKIHVGASYGCGGLCGGGAHLTCWKSRRLLVGRGPSRPDVDRLRPQAGGDVDHACSGGTDLPPARLRPRAQEHHGLPSGRERSLRGGTTRTPSHPEPPRWSTHGEGNVMPMVCTDRHRRKNVARPAARSPRETRSSRVPGTSAINRSPRVPRICTVRMAGRA